MGINLYLALPYFLRFRRKVYYLLQLRRIYIAQAQAEILCAVVLVVFIGRR